MKMQHRSLPFTVKALDEAKGTFSGYGSVFDVVDAYKDVIAAGAFKQTLLDWEKKASLPKMLWQHDPAEPIGVWTKMQEDDHGLFAEGRILVDAGATEKRAFEHIKAGSVDGLSIGFSIPAGGISWDSSREVTVIKAVKLWELSVVTFPANDEALIDQVRAAVDSPKEFERLLRDAGFSRSMAKALMSGGYKALSQRDADDEAEVADAIKNLTARFSSGA